MLPFKPNFIAGVSKDTCCNRSVTTWLFFRLINRSNSKHHWYEQSVQSSSIQRLSRFGSNTNCELWFDSHSVAVLTLGVATLFSSAATSPTGVPRALNRQDLEISWTWYISIHYYISTAYNSFTYIVSSFYKNSVWTYRHTQISLSYPRSPSWAPGDPTDLCVTDSAAQPITAFFLLHNDTTLRTMHSLTRQNKSL